MADHVDHQQPDQLRINQDGYRRPSKAIVEALSANPIWDERSQFEQPWPPGRESLSVD